MGIEIETVNLYWTFSMHDSTEELEEQANQFYEAQDFERAGSLFHQLWDTRHDAYSGGRYAHCLRKAGFPDAGLRIAQMVLEQFPQDIHVKREVVWALYDARFRPQKEEQNLAQLQKTGRDILQLTDELLPRKLVVFGVIDVAKDKMKWDVVRQWCDALDHDALDHSPRELGGKRVISELEQWYFAKIKSLIETETWEEVLTVADAALERFPRNQDYKRWYAQALAGQGNLQSAITELEPLANDRRASWFVLRDLADVYFKFGNFTSAYETACRAALAHGEDKAKIYLYLLIAKIALSEGDQAVAARHVALTKAIQVREGWRISQEISMLEKEIKHDDVSAIAQESISDHIGTLRSSCRDDWLRMVPQDKLPKTDKKRAVNSPLPVDSSLHSGVVKKYISDRGFGFIQHLDQGGDIFFHISNWESDRSPMEGDTVSFQVGQGKKDLEALRVRLQTDG